MYSPVSVAMAGCSEGGTAAAMSGRARALNESNPAHSNLAPTVAATLTPCHFSLQQNYLLVELRALADLISNASDSN